ncbi:hypothetical protein [Streptomyces sp. NPDC090025]|uniref:hypothetical protein n=1 Tax=Streptomyces sp. NPDC090025 TaxID=3365922 RepID=UPI003835F5E0
MTTIDTAQRTIAAQPPAGKYGPAGDGGAAGGDPAGRRLRARLAELRREYAEGEDRLRALLRQESVLRETMLRISGAAQVLQELLAEEPEQPEPPEESVLAVE